MKVAVLVRQQLANGQSRNAQVVQLPEVAHDQSAQRVTPQHLGKLARAGANPALEIAGQHAGAAPNAAFGHRTLGRGLDGFQHMFGVDVPAADVVEPGVVTLADHRNDDVVDVANAREVVDHVLHCAVRDLTDRQRVGQEDGRLDQPPLHHLREA